MKSLTFVGILLLIIGFIFFKLQSPFPDNSSLAYGILIGAGIGLIIGGIVGYSSKTKAVNRQKKLDEAKARQEKDLKDGKKVEPPAGQI